MVDRPERVAAGMSAEDFIPRDVLIETAIAKVALHPRRSFTSRIARTSKPGRAIVPVDAIAPGEAPPEWNNVVRFVSSCVVQGRCWDQARGRRGRARRRKPSPGGMYL